MAFDDQCVKMLHRVQGWKRFTYMFTCQKAVCPPTSHGVRSERRDVHICSQPYGHRFSRILESWPARRILESFQFTNHQLHSLENSFSWVRRIRPEAVPFPPAFRCPAFVELLPHTGPCWCCPAFLRFQVAGRRVQGYGGNDPSPNPFAIASPVTWPESAGSVGT